MKHIPIHQVEQTVEYPIGHALILSGFDELSNSRPSGAYRTAHTLREKGWDIEVLDYILWMPVDKVKQFIDTRYREGVTKWIGVSYTWMSSNTKAINLINSIKDWYPNLLLVIGGQFPYNYNLSADWYIFGYGEHALDAVLKYEFSTGSMPVSTELFNGRYIDAYHAYPATPLPDYSIKFVDNDYVTPDNHLTIEVSRGCKFACKFCSFPFIGMKEDSSDTEESLYRQLNENYEKWEVTNYTISDDTFNDRTDKIIKLKNAVRRLDFKPDFKAFIRLDLLKAHPEQYELLAESRTWIHYYGIETFNKRAGVSIGKGMNSDVMKTLLLQMKDYMNKNLGLYRGSAGFIAGLPHEPISDMIETEKWLQQNWSEQHWMWWPLSIFRQKGIISAFNEDMSKFGYSEIIETDKVINKNNNEIRSMNEILWRNEVTDIYECRDLVSKFQNKKELLDCFSTIRYLGMYNNDYEKVLSITRQCYPQIDTFDYRKRTVKLIKEYVEKKIN
jgi:hypothetical protein